MRSTRARRRQMAPPEASQRAEGVDDVGGRPTRARPPLKARAGWRRGSAQKLPRGARPMATLSRADLDALRLTENDGRETDGSGRAGDELSTTFAAALVAVGGGADVSADGRQGAAVVVDAALVLFRRRERRGVLRRRRPIRAGRAVGVTVDRDRLGARARRVWRWAVQHAPAGGAGGAPHLVDLVVRRTVRQLARAAWPRTARSAAAAAHRFADPRRAARRGRANRHGRRRRFPLRRDLHGHRRAGPAPDTKASRRLRLPARPAATRWRSSRRMWRPRV